MRLLSIFLLLTFSCTFSFAQTELRGTVTDEKTGEPIIFGTVAVYQNDILITGVETDFDGQYSIVNLQAGSYQIVFSYTGFADQKVNSIEIKNKETTTLNKSLPHSEIGCCCYFEYIEPLVKQDDTTQGFKFSAEQMSKMAFRW